MSFENKNYAFAGTFVEELSRSGVKHACICPGSRSSPLAISFARNKDIHKWVHLDERSAAFFALGIAKCTGQPVAVVCSSGTAAANFLPAVVEAYYSGIPLLVLTADRPPELHGWGALQTINQSNLFGNHVRWSAEMPVPEVTAPLLAFVRAAAVRAVTTACGQPSGPVHINFPFREPLEPVNVAADFPAGFQPDENCPARSFACTTALSKPSPTALKKLAGEIAGKQGLIICGPDGGENVGEGVALLAKSLGFPVLADCLSQVRCGKHDLTNVIDNYDLFLEKIKTAPEVFIRFGAIPVSKSLAGYLERNAEARHILVDPGSMWRNPAHTAAEIWQVDGTEFCRGLAAAAPATKRTLSWNRTWRQTSAKIRAAADKTLADHSELFEGKVFTELAKILPGDSVVFTGNSMPVRDMDTFFPSTASTVRFMANRGASGIDGVTSTALGVAAVNRGRVFLVIGDVSFYHDMNGLLAAKAFKLDATIIVINNDGGGIFSFLPQSAYKDIFEKYFGTPHGMNFKPTADLYGLNYAVAGDWNKFNKAVLSSLKRKGVSIIEVPGDRERNLTLHRETRKQILSILPLKGRQS